MVKLNSIKKNADVLFASNIWMPKVLHFYELKFGIWHQIGYVQNHERHCIIKYDWIICMQKSLPTTIYVWSHCVRGFIPMDGRIYIKIIYIMCIKIIPTAWAVHGCTACLNIALWFFSKTTPFPFCTISRTFLLQVRFFGVHFMSSNCYVYTMFRIIMIIVSEYHL